MSNFWQSISQGTKPSTADTEHELSELCEHLHACDCIDCPVYQERNGDIDTKNTASGCDTFKDGKRMLAALRGERV